LTIGDFFTPTFDLSASVPLGGVSFTKFYSMDPYFIQYPTAAFQTEVAFPSIVQVRVNGNLVAQRQVPPGPVDITNISGVTGGQNVSVVIRDPFGREQVLQRPFFFATNAGLAEGLHEYSYNLGFLRRQYGVESADYGPLAAAAFHRYAFTDQLTLGLRGQGTEDLYNIGPFGTYQSAWGIVGGGVSIGGHDGHTGAAAAAAYSFTGGNFSVNLGAQYLARDFAQLSDLEVGFRARTNQYASASAYALAIGTLTATYTALTTYDGPQTKLWNLSYTRGMLDGKALLALNYTRTQEPQTTNSWLLSFRYFFDSTTSVVAAAGGAGNRNTQALSLEKSIPQGEGIGYSLTGGHAGGGGSDGAFGRAFVQVNAAHATFGADYSRASTPEAGPGLSQVFLAGSIGYVGGSVFATRPVVDSFALVRVPELREVPVYANGWFVGNTDSAGEVVATNISSYYDNFITFGTSELPLDYVFPSAEKVISPPTRSGTLVTFEIRKNRAVYGALVDQREGKPVPLEFRELNVTHGDVTTRGFTGRRGEFYIEGVEPGEYQLRPDGEPTCTARVKVPETGDAMTDVGTVACLPAAR
jgi:outer membrane usher protein FimD/PapC